jgi:hypothetical protein
VFFTGSIYISFILQMLQLNQASVFFCWLVFVSNLNYFTSVRFKFKLFDCRLINLELIFVISFDWILFGSFPLHCYFCTFQSKVKKKKIFLLFAFEVLLKFLFWTAISLEAASGFRENIFLLVWTVLLFEMVFWGF